MIQHPYNGGNNSGAEFFPQQNESNSQFENSNKISRNPEVNINLQKSTPLTSTGQRFIPSTLPVNRGTTHIFYKTRMCQKFLEGSCRNGDSCTFAHGSNDLREPPPNWQELVNHNRGGIGGGNWNDDQKIINQMRICRKFVNGDECPYGQKCNFLHESPAKFKSEAAMDTGRTRESSVINIQTMVDRGQSQSQTEASQDFVRIVNTDYGLADLHTPVGRVEGDRHHYVTGSVAANAVRGPIIEPLANGSGTAGPIRQGELKGFWKIAHKKINRIYGDWIDDEEDESS